MRAIGIDLGTTNSVAAIGGSEVKVLPSSANEMLTPSVVSYAKRRGGSGEVIVGRAAANNAMRDPLNTIFSIKRLMGRVYDEPRVEEVRHRFGFSLAPAPTDSDADQRVRVMLNGEARSPEEISALILKQVKADAETALGDSVTHAVITVPAYFEERQRKATADASELAGLKLLKIIDEPTAAAIAFGLGKELERHRVLVYDLGGGTFDISIIQMTGGQYTVLDTAGNNWLGGDDFDLTIVRRMIAWVNNEYQYDPSTDITFLTKAKVEAERAKIALSAQQSYIISAPVMFKVPDVGAMVDLEMEITRAEFEADIRSLVDETICLIKEAMQHQHLTTEDITEVLLVGGSTAVPLVQQQIYDLFGQAKVKRHVNPMECVALGAAILAADFKITPASAGQPDLQSTAKRVQPVTSMNLGIATVKDDNPDVFVTIIPKGTPYPLTDARKKLFYLSEDNQTLIRVPVYEGFNERASLNEQQGVIEFPLPEGVLTSTPVEVCFNYDANRVLTVGIRILGTDYSHSETLKHGRARVQPGPKTLGEDWRDTLQASINTSRLFIETYGEYLSAEDRDEIVEAAKQGEASLRQGNQSAGQNASLLLRSKLLGSDIASLLFIAERSMQGLSQDTSQILARAVASLRTAHARRNKAEVERLSSELRLVVAQLLNQKTAVRAIQDRKSGEDLLTDRGA